MFIDEMFAWRTFATVQPATVWAGGIPMSLISDRSWLTCHSWASNKRLRKRSPCVLLKVYHARGLYLNTCVLRHVMVRKCAEFKNHSLSVFKCLFFLAFQASGSKPKLVTDSFSFKLISLLSIVLSLFSENYHYKIPDGNTAYTQPL